jgi:WD40 repeat protein
LKLSHYFLVSGSEDKSVRIWNLEEFFKTTVNHSQDETDKDAQSTVLHRRRGQVILKEIRSACLRTLHGHESTVKSIDFNSMIIVSGDIHGIVRLWHTQR